MSSGCPPPSIPSGAMGLAISPATSSGACDPACSAEDPKPSLAPPSLEMRLCLAPSPRMRDRDALEAPPLPTTDLDGRAPPMSPARLAASTAAATTAPAPSDPTTASATVVESSPDGALEGEGRMMPSPMPSVDEFPEGLTDAVAATDAVAEGGAEREGDGGALGAEGNGLMLDDGDDDADGAGVVVGDMVGDAVPVALADDVGVGDIEWLAATDGEADAVTEDVDDAPELGDAVAEGVGHAELEGEGDELDVVVAVALMDGELELLAVTDGDAPGLNEGVAVTLADGVPVAAGVTDGVAGAVAEGDEVGDPDWLAVEVAEAEPDADGVWEAVGDVVGSAVGVVEGVGAAVAVGSTLSGSAGTYPTSNT